MKKYVFKKLLRSFISAVSLILILCLGLNVPINAVVKNDQTKAVNNIDLGLNCKSAVLMEASSGKILYEQNPDEALPPASVTKIMTLLLVMEAIETGKVSYTDMVRASANACSMGGSQIYLEENEEMSLEDMLKSVVIASANDAAVALAEHISGTEEAFVEQMNIKAEELGMTNTKFENTNGLDDTVENHLTSARDIAIMSRELIKYPKITEYSSIWMDSIRNGEFGLTNTNRLIRFYKGATGLKTGSTSKAGFCISATAERDGMTLIAVIMGAESRDIRNAAAVSLLDYGFANYGIYLNEGKSDIKVNIKKGIEPYVDLQYSSFICPIGKNEISQIKVEESLPDVIDAPVRAGDVVGQIIYKSGDKEIGRSDITVKNSVEKLSFGNMILIFFRKFATYL